MSSEFGDIRDEDILRQMWQETDDFGRKKEIRTHMYKLREARLREFYIKEMESKSPITSRHEDAMADHSFEGFKSNEIRGVDNPLSDIKFGPISGNTGGWNVISSSETSDGGKARTEKMLATTEGVTAIDGGKKAFSGKNEELKTERYDGDANNFTYSTGESSNMSLSENIVMGDENNKRIENKSSTVSHSSKVVRSSANSGDVMIQDDFQKPVREHDLRSSSVNSEHSSTTKSHVEQKNATSTSDNVKLSQDSSTVKEAFRLSNEPGRIISRHVERANPSTNMVIEKKELADGTIVTTKRYETVNSDRINHVDLQPASRDSRSSSVSSTHKSDTKTHQDSINKTSQNVETTFKTSRDEEAFRLSQQPGKILSRDVELKDPTTKMITEKKELHDGTIVTTKRYEKIDSSSTNVHDNQSTKNFKSDIKSTTEENRKTSTNETFKTSRDEEAFRLAQQPGKIIFRDVQMANPTTRMITEKKELTDGTVVTTKRYESVDSDSQSTKSFTKEQKSDNFSKNLRSDSSTTSKTEEVRKTTQNVDQKTAENVNQTSQKFDQQTFKTARDEEAFRLAQQPGKIISREVEMANPTTKRITEKKELTDGTIVTTKRYETIDSDTQSVKSFKEENNSDDFSKNLRNESITTRNVKETFKTARDEEAFRLAQQPGKIISREVEITNPTTKRITEKKELTDGTIVTTKRYETIDSDTQSVKSFKEENTSDNFTKNLRNDSTTTRNVKETSKAPRDDAPARLSDQPAKVISRNVEMTNPTTRTTTEKKELHDGTIVTTKRIETIDSDTQSVKSFREENTFDNFAKNLRKDSTTKKEDIRKVDKTYDNLKSSNQTFKTPRDEEAFRLAQQPGKVLSRDVEMTNTTTRMITEKKELTDGTIVTTKRFENVNEPNEPAAKNVPRDNVEPRNVRKTFTDSNAFDTDDKNTEREIVEETVTRKVFDTSCKCPEDHKPNNREFINKERNDDHYDMTSEIISNVDNRRQTKKQNLTEVEKNREELMTREEARRVEQRRIEEQIKRQEQKRITKDLEVDSAHRAFASSLRCVTPPNERVATPNVPRMDYRTTRSPSHETTTSKISTSTVTLRKSSIDRPSPRPLSSEQPSKPNKKTTPESRKPTTQTVETIEIDTRNKKRPVSPQKVVQPRTTSPNKLPQKSQPKKLFTDDSPKILRETSPQKQQKPKGSVTRDVPSKSRPSSNESSPRATSPQKSSPNSGSASPRGVSPQKYPTSSRDSSPSKPYVETTRTTKPKDSDDELMTTTITIDNKDTKFRDDLRITQTVDSKNISATTSVSDLEFISANDRRLLTDLDSEDNLQIKIDVANLKDDDLKIKTTIREVDRKSPSKPDDNDKKIFQRRETFEERASKLIGVTPESPSRDVPSYLKPTFSSLPATDRNVTEVVGRKTKDNQEIERTQRKSVTTESEDFITREKNETRRTTHTYSSPDQSPTRNYSKPTTPKDETRRPTHTYSSPDQSPTRSYSKPTTPKDETRRPTHTYSSPDQSPTRNYSKPTTPKDETRRTTHTYSSPDQSPTRNYSKPTTPKDETRRPTHTYSSPDQSPTRNYSKPTTPKDETRRPTHTYSSPDQSPTRSYSKPTSQKPSETKKPYERPNEKGDLTNVPDTKTTKPSTTRTSSPDKKKPSSVDSPTRTSQRFVNETKTTRRVTTEDEDRSPVRPESQTPAGKPSRVVTNKTTKTFIETTRTSKASPTNRLVKRPTDISTTDQDSDVETEENLIKNIDKSTSKTTRKKLIQGRKDSAPVTRTTTRSDKEKVSRSNTDTVIRTDTTTSSKKTSNIQARKDSVRPSKVITTKTTNVNTINSNTLDDVLIDIQQAKSSREASPNKMIPTPVHPDEDINGDQMIYPDKVTEPDDFKRQAPKVKNIPIFEEKTKKFVGIEITEVGTDQSRIILEEEEHEDREVINSSILERADRKRNSIQIDPIDDEDDDDDHTHLLSVSQKVHKFIETAEELKKPKTSAPFKSDDVKLEDVSEPEDDSRLTVNRKVTKFSTTNDELSSKELLKSRKTIRETVTTSYDEVDENLRDDECLLSVTDKVNKFITSAEKLVSSSPQKSPELVKNIMKTSTKSSRSNDEDINESFLTREKVSTLSRGDRSDSKSTVKSENSDITLKSTEAIKRARAVFETNTASRDVKRHDDIMSRPSVFDAKRTPTSDRKSYTETATTRSTTSREKSPSRERHSPYKDYDSKSPSPSSPRRGSSERTPAYMRDQVSTKKELFEKRISSSRLENDMSHQKSISPQHSVNERSYRSESEERHQRTRKVSSDKHYMSHTVASLEHVNTERRDSELERTSRHESNSGSRRDSVTRTPTKFHRNISESTNDSAAMESPRTPTKFGVELKRTDSGKHVQTRKVSAGGETINVEEIFDLDELERLLEIVVGYEQRRRIRAQIRLVRKIISEREMNNEIKTSTKTTRARNASPSRKETTTKVSQRFVESPEKIPRERIEKIVTTTTTTRISGSDKPRDVVTTKSTKVFDKGSAPRSVIESLNKTGKVKSENVVKTTRKTSATSSALKTNTTRESRVDGVDSVTSSYGVGPTDSNGLPLFGLKALKKKTPTTTKESKTTGSTYTEVSYSENGRPATVERKTTRYSTDPSDFDNKLDSDYKKGERKGSRGGMYSVTKTEKFVDDGTTPSSKVIRRGSVKELKEKFVRKDSSSKVTESSSSKKETKRSSVDHRDSESENETYRISRQYRSSSRDSKTFLNSEKKASNVQEVMSYMKNADRVRVDGDTKEDAESRALLNKFLGASALMTSIENNSGLSKEFLSTGGKTAKNQRTPSGSKVTKTVTSYSTAKSYDINDIWDADLLRKLLEATTNYEDRRKIRARLRQVMADKEVCAEVVNQLTTELEGESIAVESSEEKKEEETMTKTSSEVQQQGDRIIKTTTTEVITKSAMQPQQKMSPFAKFRQLDRQNSLPNPKTPTTPTTPGGSKVVGRPLFVFTDPNMANRALTAKDSLLLWCQTKTFGYENVNIENFSTSWSDGLAFCALIHHYLPDAFDFSKLTPKDRRHNFTLAFRVADEKAGIAPLLDVDDMVMYKKPDWKCVFCYVQSIYRRFRNED
ncbi:CLUMA_CG017480, isoform B [Clunio marinus]|uniref:CLUMA_CG017480, isoform B n=1 Tax=Clunio marinus TaxID=568069 RepID=A0A1J1IW04_9DIPT|nr:CLUMA_CG017480, isoform B [Clunio marinus]